MSLRDTCLRLIDTLHPLSDASNGSVPFFRTVANSPALIARARAIASELQATLTDELARDQAFEGDATLLAEFFIAGYSTVMVETARRLVAGEPTSTIAKEHRLRLDRLFTTLGHGVGQVL